MDFGLFEGGELPAIFEGIETAEKVELLDVPSYALDQVGLIAGLLGGRVVDEAKERQMNLRVVTILLSQNGAFDYADLDQAAAICSDNGLEVILT